MWYNYPTIFDKLNLFYLRASYGCDFGHFMASSGNHCPSWKCIILASGNGHEMEKGKMIHFQGPLAKFARKPWPLFFVESIARQDVLFRCSTRETSHCGGASHASS